MALNTVPVTCLKEHIDSEMQHIRLQERTKQHVREQMEGGKRMKRKMNVGWVLAMVLVLLSCSVAMGSDALNLFREWHDTTAEYHMEEDEQSWLLQLGVMAEEAQLLEDVVWEVAAEDLWPGLTVIFDQVYFDGNKLTIGFHYPCTTDGVRTNVDDPPFDERVLAYKSEDQSEENIYFWHQNKIGAEGSWARAQYQTWVDMEVFGEKYDYQYGNFVGHEQEIYGHLYTVDLTQIPGYQMGDDVELTFVAKQHLWYDYLDDQGVYYDMNVDEDERHDTFTLVVKPESK